VQLNSMIIDFFIYMYGCSFKPLHSTHIPKGHGLKVVGALFQAVVTYIGL
jgi:hypothetical protein